MASRRRLPSSPASTPLELISSAELGTGAADDAGDLPGVAFLDVAELIAGERRYRIHLDISELARRHDDAKEFGLHRVRWRVVRIGAHQVETELLDHRTCRRRLGTHLDAV